MEKVNVKIKKTGAVLKNRRLIDWEHIIKRGDAEIYEQKEKKDIVQTKELKQPVKTKQKATTKNA